MVMLPKFYAFYMTQPFRRKILFLGHCQCADSLRTCDTPNHTIRSNLYCSTLAVMNSDYTILRAPDW